MIYLCAAPKELTPARQAFSHIAHAACYIDSTGRLHASLPKTCAKEDLLLLSAEEHSSFPDPLRLCHTLKELCLQAGLSGIAADLPPPATEEKLRFLSRLRQECASACKLFVPEDFAPHLPGTIPIICTAMSGGIFNKRLEDALHRFPSPRPALDLQRTMMDFPIPAPGGTGTALTPIEFKELFSSHRPAVFFSRELCAKYFTYRRNGQPHLVLFDDISTLLEKIRIGRRMGISLFFLSYPETTDILGGLSLAANKEKTL